MSVLINAHLVTITTLLLGNVINVRLNAGLALGQIHKLNVKVVIRDTLNLMKDAIHNAPTVIGQTKPITIANVRLVHPLI